MGWLIGLALKVGVPQRFAKASVIAALVLLAIGGGALALHLYNRSIIKTHDTEQENKELKHVSAANDQAANERANETIALEHQEEETHNVIHQGPDSAPSPAAVRHNCERLRHAGRDTSKLPACSGLAGGH